jgi:hypothetical protein
MEVEPLEESTGKGALEVSQRPWLFRAIVRPPSYYIGQAAAWEVKVPVIVRASVHPFHMCRVAAFAPLIVPRISPSLLCW